MPGGTIRSPRNVKVDELVRSHPNRWLCKEATFKAREARGVRRTLCTPQRQSAAGGKLDYLRSHQNSRRASAALRGVREVRRSPPEADGAERNAEGQPYTK